VSRRITGPERKRLRQLAQELLPGNFSLTVRTEALGHTREELEKDLARLMETWKEVLERASAAAVASEQGMEGAQPVLLHRAMGQFLTIVRDFFNDKVRDVLCEQSS
jgi:Ribonuclease G/E